MSLKQKCRDAVFRTFTRLRGDDRGMVGVRVLSGPNRGARLRLDLSRFAEPGYLYGNYDRKILNIALTLGLSGKTIWDCGTYLGYYSVFFARRAGPQGRVIAFEPDPTNLSRTKENCGLNRLENVEFVHAAIGASLGEVDFQLSSVETNSHLPGAYIGASRASYQGDQAILKTIKVACLSLDEALLVRKVAAPDIVKLDIEGGELMALQHMDHLASVVRPILLLELHNPECDAMAWSFAQRYDYTLFSIDRNRSIAGRDETCGTLLCRPK